MGAHGSDAETVTVVGDSRAAFGPAALAAMPHVERRYTVACASGVRTTARWTGVPVTELLGRVDTPAETTHLRLASYDGYAVCVPVRDAFDGVVAYARAGERLSRSRPYATRFLAPGVDGERLVKGLERVETLVLAAGDDPGRTETAAPEGPDYG
jgi:DMSO/TMAO reductase YedYZ molybdopterin-dependent catalytic subunit